MSRRNVNNAQVVSDIVLTVHGTTVEEVYTYSRQYNTSTFYVQTKGVCYIKTSLYVPP